MCAKNKAFLLFCKITCGADRRRMELVPDVWAPYFWTDLLYWWLTGYYHIWQIAQARLLSVEIIYIDSIHHILITNIPFLRPKPYRLTHSYTYMSWNFEYFSTFLGSQSPKRAQKYNSFELSMIVSDSEIEKIWGFIRLLNIQSMIR